MVHEIRYILFAVEEFTADRRIGQNPFIPIRLQGPLGNAEGAADILAVDSTVRHLRIEQPSYHVRLSGERLHFFDERLSYALVHTNYSHKIEILRFILKYNRKIQPFGLFGAPVHPYAAACTLTTPFECLRTVTRHRLSEYRPSFRFRCQDNATECNRIIAGTTCNYLFYLCSGLNYLLS